MLQFYFSSKKPFIQYKMNYKAKYYENGSYCR